MMVFRSGFSAWIFSANCRPDMPSGKCERNATYGFHNNPLRPFISTHPAGTNLRTRGTFSLSPRGKRRGAEGPGSQFDVFPEGRGTEAAVTVIEDDLGAPGEVHFIRAGNRLWVERDGSGCATSCVRHGGSSPLPGKSRPACKSGKELSQAHRDCVCCSMSLCVQPQGHTQSHTRTARHRKKVFARKSSLDLGTGSRVYIPYL
jgi:hypothetical protein